jgi:hypothetical protein
MSRMTAIAIFVVLALLAIYALFGDPADAAVLQLWLAGAQPIGVYDRRPCTDSSKPCPFLHHVDGHELSWLTQVHTT